MSKNKKDKKIKVQDKPVNIIFPEHISAKEMQHIITNALIDVENVRKQREEEQHKNAIEEWYTITGYKDYSKSKWYKKYFFQFFNSIWVFFKLSFMPKRKINGNHATSALLKIFLSIFFGLIKLLLILLSLFFVAESPIECLVLGIKPFLWNEYVIYLSLSFLFFMLFSVFRMASIEIEKMDDNNYLLGIFASVTSIISIVVAIISIVK